MQWHFPPVLRSGVFYNPGVRKHKRVITLDHCQQLMYDSLHAELRLLSAGIFFVLLAAL